MDFCLSGERLHGSHLVIGFGMFNKYTGNIGGQGAVNEYRESGGHHLPCTIRAECKGVPGSDRKQRTES